MYGEGEGKEVISEAQKSLKHQQLLEAESKRYSLATGIPLPFLW
jgi:hypothetical protein